MLLVPTAPAIKVPDASLCEVLFNALRDRYRDCVEEFHSLTKLMEKECNITEDPVARRDLALLQLVIASCKLDCGDDDGASHLFRCAIGQMHLAGETAAPLRPLALRLSQKISIY